MEVLYVNRKLSICLIRNVYVYVNVNEEIEFSK